jgi:hypothetical protein
MTNRFLLGDLKIVDQTDTPKTPFNIFDYNLRIEVVKSLLTMHSSGFFDTNFTKTRGIVLDDDVLKVYLNGIKNIKLDDYQAFANVPIKIRKDKWESKLRRIKKATRRM